MENYSQFMTIARRGLWIAILVVLLVEGELHLRHPVSVALALGLMAIAWAGRWPLECLVAVCLLLLGDTLAGGVLVSDLVTPLVVVAGVSFVAGGRASPTRLAIATVVCAALLTVANHVADPGSFTPANDAVFFAVLVGVPAVVGRLLETRSRQVAELRRLNAELERRQETAVRAARAKEAERVDHAVNEALAGRLQRITEGIHQSSAASGTDPDTVPAVLAAVENTSREALSELRAVLGVLHSLTPGPGAPHTSPEFSGRRGEMPTTPRRRAALDLTDLGLILLVVPLAFEASLQPSSGSYWLNIIACAAQGVLLMAVRRAPMTGALFFAVAACAQSAFLVALPQTVSWALPALVLAFLLGLHVTWRRRWWGLALCCGTALAVELSTPSTERNLEGLPPVLVALALTWWAGITVAARQLRATELITRAEKLSRTADANASLAAAEQRADMARELHDVGAHTLTVVCLQSVAAQTLWDRDRDQACMALAILSELAAGPLEHLSVSLVGLTAATTSAPLDVTALEVFAGIGRVLGLEVDVDVRGTPRPLPDDVAKAAFRVVQESLTNAARHAPGGVVKVGLSYERHDLEVRIQDSGPAATTRAAVVPIHGSGIGLQGMRERVEACRGELECGVDECGGFHVLARLPMAVAP